jgi:ATP-dependent DNA ligase
VVFRHACKMGLEGIVSKRLGSRYRSGRSPDWLKFKNPEAPAVRLSCIAHHADGTQWVASGYTLQGGTSRKNVEPRYVRFRS